MHLLIALAGQEVNAIDMVYVKDEVLTVDGSGSVTALSKYSGKLKIYKHLATDSQAADANLVAGSSKWTSDHRAREIAYIYAQLTHDADVFPNGVRTFTCIVKGKKVFDPREAGNNSSDP